MVLALTRGPRVHHGGSEGAGRTAVRGGDSDNPRTVQTVVGPFGSVVRGRFFSIGEVR